MLFNQQNAAVTAAKIRTVLASAWLKCELKKYTVIL